MYFDLFVPFPIPETEVVKKKKDKGKAKAVEERRGCWDGLEDEVKGAVASQVGLAGHLGYGVVGWTVVQDASTHVTPCPFTSLPFPKLDPRNGELGGPSMVQVTRFHVRLEDNKAHPMTNANTSLLKDYDILSVQPLSDKALQLACTDLSYPGPNQISIITLPLHEKPYHFRLNRKQIKQAQRNGVMFELIYGPGLFPSPKTSVDVTRRYRQNFLTNAREVIRITNGKNIILSSGGPSVTGVGYHLEGIRGPLDVVNLGTMLGMLANLAKDSVSTNPKRVLLNAQSRRTFKATFSTPVVVPPPISVEVEERVPSDRPSKKIRVQ